MSENQTKTALIRHLAVGYYAQGFTCWHYRLPLEHTLDMTTKASYWASHQDMIAPGDVIVVTNDRCTGQIAVLKSSAGLVYRMMASAQL